MVPLKEPVKELRLHGPVDLCKKHPSGTWPSNFPSPSESNAFRMLGKRSFMGSIGLGV